jgi:GNAT superfamily N-acetyltransferase
MDNEVKKVIYRRANVNDVETLVEYRVRFLNELYNHPENDETKILRKKLREYFSRTIPSKEFIAWLAECNGKIVGTGGMVVWQLPSRYGGLESGRAGYVLNFYTVPETRRKGICTHLLNELIKEAKSLGIRYLHLHASKDGISIYRKAGFVEPNQTELKLVLPENET